LSASKTPQYGGTIKKIYEARDAIFGVADGKLGIRVTNEIELQIDTILKMKDIVLNRKTRGWR
jgi:hypothetical protein